MAEESASSSSVAAGNDVAGTVNLRIISPSTNVPSPLHYNDLPHSTTIGELKSRLRGELMLPVSSDVHLRLIHRGRVLDTDAVKLLDVFGPASVRGIFVFR